MQCQCEQCQSKWESPQGLQLRNCPFCQAEVKIIDTRTDEEKMVFIVEKFSVEIYESPMDFCAVVDENFQDDEMGRLLKFLIPFNAAQLVLNLRDVPPEQLQEEFDKIIAKLEYDTFTIPQTTTPAVTLLCHGLGIELKAARLSASLTEGFEIVDGVLKKYIGTGVDVVIPDSITSIGDSAFKYCSSLTQVTIPNSVTSIEANAFLSCKNLTQVTIPNSVTSIGYWAFYYCSSLTEITIPDSVTRISGRAFFGCSNLTQATIDKILSINPSALD